MKHLKLFIIFFIPLFMTGCFQKRAYTLPLVSGEYISEEPFSFNNRDYIGMRLIVKEISNEEFTSSKKENTLQDFSLPVEERKFYSIKFFLLEEQNEIPVSMHFKKKCNPHATGPNLYIITLDIPVDDKTTSYSADFRIAEGISQDPSSYYLNIENNSKDDIFIRFKTNSNTKS